MIGFSNEQEQKKKITFFAVTMLTQGFTDLSNLQNVLEKSWFF